MSALLSRSRPLLPPPRRWGPFTLHSYRSLLDGSEHLAAVHGSLGQGEGVLARVHSESMLGDVFGCQRCDSGSQLDGAMERIAAAGAGVLVYLRGQQGRGLGLAQELGAYAAAEAGEACANPAALEDAAFPVGGARCRQPCRGWQQSGEGRRGCADTESGWGRAGWELTPLPALLIPGGVACALDRRADGRPLVSISGLARPQPGVDAVPPCPLCRWMPATTAWLPTSCATWACAAWRS